jgi:triosephosphate isomerase
MFCVIGQQKLYLSTEKSAELARDLTSWTKDRELHFELFMCPSFINIVQFSELVKGTKIRVGAQNFNQPSYGAHTGQVALPELISAGASAVILGHYEVRTQLNEPYSQINRKLKACLECDVIPVLCFGDTAVDRAANRSEAAIVADMNVAFDGVSAGDLADKKVILAYDPPWAIKSNIGDGNTRAADPAIVAHMHHLMRMTLRKMFGSEVINGVQILYGGSVEHDSTIGLVAQDEVDGLLVGSASTSSRSFTELLMLVQQSLQKYKMK